MVSESKLVLKPKGRSWAEVKARNSDGRLTVVVGGGTWDERVAVTLVVGKFVREQEE